MSRHFGYLYYPGRRNCTGGISPLVSTNFGYHSCPLSYPLVLFYIDRRLFNVQILDFEVWDFVLARLQRGVACACKIGNPRLKAMCTVAIYIHFNQIQLMTKSIYYPRMQPLSIGGTRILGWYVSVRATNGMRSVDATP
jgi:hypothetical protein